MINKIASIFTLLLPVLAYAPASLAEEGVCNCDSGLECYNQSITYKHDGKKSLARSCLAQSCQLGDSYGCNLMGDMYQFSEIGVTQDLAKALEYYKKACSMGERIACSSASNLE